ncbi:hypothetical protein [Terasakiella pusilla]|uniref:hypothetical protein n=1 Tax=Terasakiella pusilla TaxID=64973 RepID=UPI003AA91BF8
MQFELGLLSVLFSIAFLILFFLAKMFGSVGAYAYANEELRDRRPIKFWIPVCIVLGVAFGGVIQGTINQECYYPSNAASLFPQLLENVCFYAGQYL